MAADDLPEAEQRVYYALVYLHRDLGYPPTIKEIGVRCGMSVGSVHRHLAALMQRGLIVRDIERGARSIRIIGVDTAADIVRDLAKMAPTFRHGGATFCALCNRSRSGGYSVPFDHDESCPWLRARKLTGSE